MKRRVLFLCSGNTSRSQMAEAIVNARLADRWQAFSAGIHPGKTVHPNALTALEEIGIHHSGYPKSVDKFRDADFDLVVTVCDAAAEECPLWLGKGRIVHHDFLDPARTGLMDDFRTVREAITQVIPEILAEFEEKTA
jgi:arsenate reductase (thioredoxin)